MAKKKRISNSFSEEELHWLDRLLAATSNKQGVEVTVFRDLARTPELTSVYQKVLRMKRKLEEM
jgi:hypothetical protein